MASYVDALEPLLAAEQALRLTIARRIAQENAETGSAAPARDQMAAADAAIEAWRAGGEDEHDPAAFRPIGPLQQMLADHAQICERIADICDRRLS